LKTPIATGVFLGASIMYSQMCVHPSVRLPARPSVDHPLHLIVGGLVSPSASIQITQSRTHARTHARRELLLFAIFVGLGRTANSDAERNTNNAMAVFSFFLFVLYAVFSACLFCFRHYVIGE
jgi:hypothetical protein